MDFKKAYDASNKIQVLSPLYAINWSHKAMFGNHSEC